MKKYRIDIYEGWSVYAGLISREYKYFLCVDDAKIYAYSKIQGTNLGFSVLEVIPNDPLANPCLSVCRTR